MMRRDDLLSARERAQFSFSFVTSGVHLRTRHSVYSFITPSSTDGRTRFDGPHRQVQGHCTLIHGLFRKNPRHFSLSLSLIVKPASLLFVLRELPQFKDHAEIAETMLFCIHVVHSPPLLSSPLVGQSLRTLSRRVAARSVPHGCHGCQARAYQGPWHPHMAHYYGARRRGKKARSAPQSWLRRFARSDFSNGTVKRHGWTM